MKRSLRSTAGELCRDERGLSTIEYVVLLVLIVALAVGAWNSFGGQLMGKLGNASDRFDLNAPTGGDGAGGDMAGAGRAGADLGGGDSRAGGPTFVGSVAQTEDEKKKRKPDPRKTDDPAHTPLDGTGHGLAE